MTQTPLPPPPGSSEPIEYQSADRAIGLARRTSLLLWVLGGVGLCLQILSVLAMTMQRQQLVDQLMASAPPEMRRQFSQSDMQIFADVAIVIAACIAVFLGVSLIVGGYLVRRGSRAAMVYAIIIVGLCGLLWFINVLTGILHLARGMAIGAAEALLSAGICFAFGLCLYWLIGTLRAANAISKGRVRSPRQIQYPPGYASGYGAQRSMPIPPPPETAR
jgi:hypothetical protein